MLVAPANSTKLQMYWVTGIPTKNLADRQELFLPSAVFVSGTKRYTTAAGTDRTVFVLEPLDVQSILHSERLISEQLTDAGVRKALVGVWRVSKSSYQAEWGFREDGSVTSNNGAPKGKWTLQKDKRRIFIEWGGPANAWETFNLPIISNQAKGESWSNDPLEATKLP